MGIPAPTELLLILGVVLLLFGTKRIPEVMGGVAQGIKTFKRTMDSDETHAPSVAQSPAQMPPDPAKDTQQSRPGVGPN